MNREGFEEDNESGLKEERKPKNVRIWRDLKRTRKYA